MSTQDIIKLLKQLQSGFKRTTNLNKYQSKTTNQAQNRYLEFLIDPSFEKVKRLSVLSFKYENGRENCKQYYLPAVEKNYYNVMVDRRNLFDQPIKNNLKTNDNIRKIATG